MKIPGQLQTEINVLLHRHYKTSILTLFGDSSNEVIMCGYFSKLLATTIYSSIISVFFGTNISIAQVEFATSAPVASSSGWVSPGQSVSFSTNVTSNLNIQNVNVGYSIFNATTGAWLASQAVNYPSLASGQTVSATQTFTIPAGATPGVYRVAVELINNWPFAASARIWSDSQAGCFTVVTSPSANYGIPTRGCSELPSSRLRTIGGQIIDNNGTPIRISAANWSGSSGPAKSASDGLFAASYKDILKSIKQNGYNAVRVTWSDVNLYARPNSYWSSPAWGAIDVDAVRNSDLWDLAYPQPNASGQYTFLPTIEIFKKYVDYAKQIGLKIIFMHHTNEGTSGQQSNGLWFDVDAAYNYHSNGSAAGNGTISYETFKANTVALATKFSNEPTVIGFELHNEPLSLGQCTVQNPFLACQPVPLNWGVTNNKYDIKYMAQDVGNAILAVNTNALVILEAPLVYWIAAPNLGMDPIIAMNGNLTAVGGFGSTGPNPVVLSAPHRVAYSVHEYPREIAWPGNTDPASVDYGTGYLTRMNKAWGYLPAQNMAPVIVTELGGFFPDAPGSASSAAINWISTLLPYLNSMQSQYQGPSLIGNQQPVSAAWWRAGVGSSTCCDPNGTQTAWGNDPNSFVQSVRMKTDALGFRGIPSVTSHHTVIGIGASIKDSNGNIWAILDGTITVNGVSDPTSTNIVALAYIGDKIWRKTSSNLWSFKVLPQNSWSNGVASSPLTASTNGTVAMAGSAPIIDASGNFWSIGGGKILVNGSVDATTSNVVMLAYVGGVIWQKNSSGLWWSKTAPSASWLPASGTSTPPALVVSASGRVVSGNGGWIMDANKNAWMSVNGQVMVNGVPDPTSSDTIELTYVGGIIWKKNSNWSWQSKALPANNWSAATTTKPMRPATANNSMVLPGGGAIIDGTNTSWTISNGSVIIDGVRDPATSNVIALAYSNGLVWQKSASNMWWAKGGLFDVWAPLAGTATPPF